MKRIHWSLEDWAKVFDFLLKDDENRTLLESFISSPKGESGYVAVAKLLTSAQQEVLPSNRQRSIQPTGYINFRREVLIKQWILYNHQDDIDPIDDNDRNPETFPLKFHYHPSLEELTRILLTSSEVIRELHEKQERQEKQLADLTKKVAELSEKLIQAQPPQEVIGDKAVTENVSPLPSIDLKQWKQDREKKKCVVVYGVLADQFHLIHSEYKNWLDLRHVNHQCKGGLNGIPTVCDNVLVMANFASHSHIAQLQKELDSKLRIVRGGMTALRKCLDRIRAESGAFGGL